MDVEGFSDAGYDRKFHLSLIQNELERRQRTAESLRSSAVTLVGGGVALVLTAGASGPLLASILTTAAFGVLDLINFLALLRFRRLFDPVRLDQLDRTRYGDYDINLDYVTTELEPQLGRSYYVLRLLKGSSTRFFAALLLSQIILLVVLGRLGFELFRLAR